MRLHNIVSATQKSLQVILKQSNIRAFNYGCLVCIFCFLSTQILPARAQTEGGQASDSETDQAAIQAYTYGRIALQNQRYAQAIPFFAKAVQLKPRNPQFHFMLASAYGPAEQRLNQWFHLRQAVRLDPSFEAARDDFLKMWWVAFDKGVLDIGVSMDEVRAALADPDNVLTSENDERHVFWRYAFMELLFIDGKLDGTLDLRRHDAEDAGKTVLSLSFGDLDWRLKRQHLGLAGDLFEYQPAQPQNPAGAGAQRLSVEQMLGLAAGFDVRELMQQARDRVNQQDATQWKELYNKEHNVIFEWRDSGANPRHEITRIMRKNDAVYRLTYRADLADLPAAQRTRWLKILAQAKILSSADN